MKKLIYILSFIMIITLMIPIKALADDNVDGKGSTVGDSETKNVQDYQDNVAEKGQENTGAALRIDNSNVYEGMDKAYSKGYSPKIRNNKAVVIIPLEADGDDVLNEITAGVELGATEQSPFIYKNYEKTIKKTEREINDSEKKKEIFYVRFDLSLSKDRINGIYPVVINVSGKQSQGELLVQSFTIYITIKDGRDSDSADGEMPGEAEEKPSSSPVVLVEKSELKQEEPKAGDSFCADITLKNTSETKAVQNMVVTLQYESENFTLLEDSDTIFVSRIDAGGKKELSVSFSVNRNAAEGDHIITVMMSYDDESANTLTSQGAFSVSVKQELSVKLAMPPIAGSITAGDTIPLDLQAMNLSRSMVYNVSCDVEGDGLCAAKTAFFGNLEAGTEGNATMMLFAGAKSDEGGDGDKYGSTSGVIRLFYEDADGKEYSEEYDISTTIKKPVVKSAKKKPKKKDGRQWYGFVGALAFIILIGGGIYKIKKHIG